MSAAAAMGSCEQKLVEKLAVGAAPREKRDPHTPWVRWALDDGRAPSLGFPPSKRRTGSGCRLRKRTRTESERKAWEGVRPQPSVPR